MSQNGVVRAQLSGSNARSRKTAGVTTVSSLESRLQDLGLSHVVGPPPAPVVSRAPHSRPGSSAGRAPKPVPEIIDEDCTIYADETQNDVYAQDVRRPGGGVSAPQRDSRGEVRPPSSQGRSSRSDGRPRSPLNLDHDFEGGGGGKGVIRAVDSPDSIDSRHQDSPVQVKYGQVQYPPHIQPSQVIPRLPMHHYQFCPNCGYQLVENPIVNPIPRQGLGINAVLPPGTVLASALPADSSDSDSDADDDDPRRLKGSGVPTAPLAAVNSAGRRAGGVGTASPVIAAPVQAKAISQADLAAGKGRVPAQSAVILKEMEGRRVQRLKAPEGNVVGQGKGIRPGPKGVALAQEQETAVGGKHRRIGSVDHNIYSSAMPTKRGPLTMMVEASAEADAQEQDENETAASPSTAAAAAARKRGVPPLPGKPGVAQGRTSNLAPKRPEISRLQISTADEDSDDSAADAKVIDIPDGDNPKGGGNAKGTGKSKEGGLHASMPSPGHRRISSWADGGNLKHTDFILRKPYRDVMDVFDVHDEELGVGQFGVIRSCVNRSTGLLLACKTISKERIVCIEDADDVRKEVQLMQQLRGHPNIIELHETFEDSKHVHLVMELCKGGELFDRIKLRGQYSEHSAALVFQTLVEALLYCHSNGIVHRDIKPENVLLMKKDDDTVIKVIDFGVAARFRLGEVLTEFVGTPYYMAPEVLVGNYGPEADLWSAGIVLYIMLCGFPPFWGNSNDAIFDAIQNNELQFKSSKWRNVSEQAKELIRATLAKDPKKRISALDILGHPWVVSHTQSK